jgi:hypothetical protein
VSLRFARLRGYREDKSPADADTIETVRALLPAGALERTLPPRTRRGARHGRRGDVASSAQRDLFADADADTDAASASDSAPGAATDPDPTPESCPDK